MKYGLSVKENKISQVKQMLREGTRFSTTTDEYTDLKNRRYININFHGKDLPPFHLGMIRIFGSTNSGSLRNVIFERLKEYGIFETNLVCITTDGASVILKMGREIDSLPQTCQSHGIHLAVSDILYIKTRESHVISINDEELKEDTYKQQVLRVKDVFLLPDFSLLSLGQECPTRHLIH